MGTVSIMSEKWATWSHSIRFTHTTASGCSVSETEQVTLDEEL